MPKFNKRTTANLALQPTEPLELEKAVSHLKKFKAPKFDQSVEVAMFLGVDVKHADQMIRGSVSLPHGIGKTKRVIAFCQPDVAKEALANGAIKAGGEQLVEDIERGFFDFDVAIASPDMMRVISKLGRVLGPKGLMPSPKAGTVTPKVAEAVKDYVAGKVEYRTDKAGNVHAVFGKMSFDDAKLADNLRHFIETIEKARPQAAKGQYIKKIAVSGSMTPSVEIAYADDSGKEG